MIQNITDFLKEWNKKYDDRSKLQHSYAVIAIVALLIAGVVGLINHSLGQSVLFISIVFAAVFLVNAVWWALVEAFVVSKIPRRSSPSNTRKK